MSLRLAVRPAPAAWLRMTVGVVLHGCMAVRLLAGHAVP